MKIIFLDMMGVWFTTHGQVLQPEGCPILLDGRPQPGVDPEVVAGLNMILDAVEDSFVCIASTIRQEYAIGSIKKFMEDLGVRKDRVLYQTPIVSGDPQEVRGQEIDKWLQTTGLRKGCTSYVVIDDNWVHPHVAQGRQVRTCTHHGLQEHEAEDAIEILSK